MTRNIEAPRWHDPLKPLVPVSEWAGRHWKAVSTALLATVGGISGLYMLTHQDSGPQKTPAESGKASDILKPPEPASAGLPAGTKLAPVEWTPTAAVLPTATEVPPATATKEPTATEVPTATATSTPKTGFNLENGSPVYRTETGEMLGVPQIQGLRLEEKEIDGQKKTVYLAEQDNTYGLEKNAYAGEFNPNVSVENKQTGGVVLTAPVVLKLMETNTNGLGLPLPLDISENQTIVIEFIEVDLYGMYRTYIKLSLSGNTILTNIIPTDQLSIAKSIVNDETGRFYWQYTRPTPRVQNPNNPPDPKPAVLFHTDKFTSNVIASSQFGEEIDKVENSKVMISHTETNEAERKLTEDDILTVGKVPVFLAANAA